MSQSSSSRKRRRGSLQELAQAIAVERKFTVIITGAGLSVASGIRPFRGSDGLWSQVVWKQATRAAFRDNPLDWYNQFWLPHFGQSDTTMKNTSIGSTTTTTEIPQPRHEPNAGHVALRELQDLCDNVKIITQNVDGLHGDPQTHNTTTTRNLLYYDDTTTDKQSKNHDNLIEAHGRIGWYKCIPSQDSDTDSDSDEDDDRLVHLGHRRKSRALRKAYYHDQKDTSSSDHDDDDDDPTLATLFNNGSPLSSELQLPSPTTTTSLGIADKSITITRSLRIPCRYELVESIPHCLVHPPSVRPALLGNGSTIPLLTPPRCPACQSPCAPQALLFDEGYHSHDSYQFERMEHWIGQAELLVFVGTSFAVRLTNVALDHARATGLPVYNFNTIQGVLEPNCRLNVENIVGPAQQTLPQLLQACRELMPPIHTNEGPPE